MFARAPMIATFQRALEAGHARLGVFAFMFAAARSAARIISGRLSSFSRAESRRWPLQERRRRQRQQHLKAKACRGLLQADNFIHHPTFASWQITILWWRAQILLTRQLTISAGWRGEADYSRSAGRPASATT